MRTHRIKKGFDIKLMGRPAAEMADAPEPDFVAVTPEDFDKIRPKVMVKEGDWVQTGQPLFRDKLTEGLQFVSPATGSVSKVEMGPGRKLLRIEVTPTAEDSFFGGHPSLDAGAIDSVSRDELTAALKSAGLWPLVRQRPGGLIAKAELVPSAIYVNGMDTEPLAADPAFAVQGHGAELQLGFRALARLTDGSVYLTCAGGRSDLPSELAELQGVEVHRFDGPHPAGLVGTHIAAIAPLAANQVAWYLKAQEVVQIGQWLATGRYPTHRVVAVSGTGAPQARYWRVRQGAALSTLTGDRSPEGDERVINGTVLTGRTGATTDALGYYAHTVTIIPEGSGKRDLFGWALPQFGKHSASRAVFGWIFPKKAYDLDTRLNGSPRAIVNMGIWEDMTPLDIYPTQLVRAIKAGDIEEATSLGLLEVTEEDVALCTYADPCKIDVGAIIREGHDLYEEEG